MQSRMFKGTLAVLTLAMLVMATASVTWGAVPVTIVNAGFEDPVLADGAETGTIPGWTEGKYNVATPTVWEVGATYVGMWNPDTSGYTSGLAPEGENMGYTTGYAGIDSGMNQVLQVLLVCWSETHSTFLSATVGNPYLYNGGLAPDYRIELVAGGVVLDSVTGASPVDDTTWATPSLTYNSGAAPAQLGEQLEIRLIAVDDPRNDEYEVDYDAISLNATYAHPVAYGNGPYNVIPAGSVTLDGSGSIPSEASTISRYEWDLDNDGNYDVEGASPAAITYAALTTTWGLKPGNNPVGLRVTDALPAAGTSTSSTIVSLADEGLEGQLGILTPETLDGNNPATGLPWAPGDHYRLVFMTSGTTAATSADIAYYNAFVQELANTSTAYDIGGVTWNALASTPGVDAAVNTGTTFDEFELGDPVYLLDGNTLVAQDYMTMWTAIVIPQPILLTETGETSVALVWTGGSQYDELHQDQDWVVPLGGDGDPTWGNSNQPWAGKPYAWFTYWKAPNTTELPLYALSEPLVISFPVTPVTWDNDSTDGKWKTAINWDRVPDAEPDAMSLCTIDNGDVVDLSEPGELAYGIELGATTPTTLNVSGDLTVSTAVNVHAAGTLAVDGTLNAETASVAGTLIVDGTFYAETASVAGTLIVDGTFNAETGSVAGTLAGNGVLNLDPITVTGTVAPGTVAPGMDYAIGRLTVAATAELWLDSGTYNAEVSLGDGVAAIQADQILINVIDGDTQGGIDYESGTLAPKGVGRTNADFSDRVTLTVVDNPDGGVVTGVGALREFGTVDPAPAADVSAHFGQGAFLRAVDYPVDPLDATKTIAVELDIFVAMAGDADGDGLIGLLDWGKLRNNFGQTGKDWTDGNFDSWDNGTVDLVDWGKLRDKFGQSYATAGTGAAAVPEPGTFVMLLGALAGLAVLVRRRRRAA